MRNAEFFCGFALILSVFGGPASAPALAEDMPGSSVVPTSATALPLRGNPAKDTSVNLRVGLSGEYLGDMYQQGEQGTLTLILGGERDFSKELHLVTSLIVVESSWAASGLFNNSDAKPVTGVFLGEGYLSYAANPNLELKAGVLSTTFSTLSSMMNPNGFPSLSERLHLGDPEKLEASFTARQGIPVQFTISNENGTSESIPTMLINTLSLEGKPLSPLKLGGSLAYYSFAGMTQGSAQDSRLYGNTILGIGPNEAHYAYGFEGIESAATAELQVSEPLSVALQGSSILNVQAPVHHNHGIMATSAVHYAASAFKLAGDLTYYYNESDTLPASYASWSEGNNNRRGPSVGLRLDLRSTPLSVYGRWIGANVIDPHIDPYQADRNSYILGTETTYALY